ncbi:zinc finger protein ZAT3-like [Forsythia ovata]|uniref:Zinc finger protein ZAT3-like n=1 Tax=Forsythia ovata TaxID=205694 RepID=A0ABD1PZB7_9LAMI
MNINNYVSSDFQSSMSFSGQETCPRTESESPHSGFHIFNRHQNPRKKRTKFISIDNSLGTSSSGVTKPKCSKKPDPSAPKITRPCSECGKKFWSWKALFGHMRCHPERQWRGINPPPNFRRLETTVSTDREGGSGVTEEDHEGATCLLMLANGGSAAASDSPSVTNVCSGMLESDSGGVVGVETFRFECSSCKKVFGSHQALGGHRASHKNVKGSAIDHELPTNRGQMASPSSNVSKNRPPIGRMQHRISITACKVALLTL